MTQTSQAGYTIDPHYPFDHFSLRLPQVGVASEASRMRGYVTPQQDGAIEMRVRVPAGAKTASLRTFANGSEVPHTLDGGFTTFRLDAHAGSPADWAVTWSGHA